MKTENKTVVGRSLLFFVISHSFAVSVRSVSSTVVVVVVVFSAVAVSDEYFILVYLSLAPSPAHATHTRQFRSSDRLDGLHMCIASHLCLGCSRLTHPNTITK